LKDIRAFIDELYAHDLHAKRVDSLSAATLGVMTGASLAVAMIGQALAQARGLVTNHAIKQVDRMLSNESVDVWESFTRWVPHLVGSQTDIVVASWELNIVKVDAAARVPLLAELAIIGVLLLASHGVSVDVAILISSFIHKSAKSLSSFCD
jgi:hypothetical protein